MTGDLFSQFSKLGQRVIYDIGQPDVSLGQVNTGSTQMQLSVPENTNTPYSQIANDDGNLPAAGGADVVQRYKCKKHHYEQFHRLPHTM